MRGSHTTTLASAACLLMSLATVAHAQEFDVSQLSPSRGAVTPFDMIVYSPNIPSSPQTSTWATYLQREKKNSVAVEAVNPAAFISGLPFLKKKNLCIRRLLLAAHGFPGEIIFGRQSLPKTNIIGTGPGQTDANKFGAALHPYLCEGATIRLLACQVAAGEVGKKMISYLAAGAAVPVYAYDDVVYFGFDLRGGTKSMTATSGGLWRVLPPFGEPTLIESATRPSQRLIVAMP